MALLQNVLRAKEAHTRSGEALDNIVRLLIEEEATDDPATTPRPKSVPDGRPSQRPTHLHEAVGYAHFAQHVHQLHAEAKTEDQRRAVLDLVKKANETGLITEAERDFLSAELKR